MSKTTPKDLAKKRNDEKLLVSEMIALYCRKQHHSPKENLCPECQQLHDYALARAADAAGASHPFHPACGRHIEIEAGSPGRKISTHV